MTRIRFNDDWAFIGMLLAVYPRDDGTFSIGRSSGTREYRDVETGFANQQAAIDQAVWRAENPTMV